MVPATNVWETGNEIDLRYYWNVINRRKWSIIGLALMVGLLTLLIVFAMTPIYQASATLLIESKQAKVVSIEEIYASDVGAKEYFATQLKILSARPIAESVVDKLDLSKRSEFVRDSRRSWLPFGVPTHASSSQPEARADAVETYLDKLSVVPIRNTQLVQVNFESPDPELAARVANAHAKAYIDGMLEVRMRATRSAAEWMSGRVESLRQELQASEAALQAYREQEQLVDVAGLKALPAQQISDLSARLLEARQKRSAAEIAYLQVNSAAGQVENLQGVPALLADEGVRRTQATQAAAQQNVAELAKRYGPSHPRLIAGQADLTQATENLKSQTRRVTESIKRHYEAAKSEEAAIVSAIDHARQQYQSAGRKESKLESLQRAVDTNRKLYELFYQRLSETSAAGDLSAAQEARIIVPALAPRLPVRPKKGLISLTAVLLTLLLGAGVSFLLASLDNTIKSSADVEEKLKCPLLGTVPLLKGDTLRMASTLQPGGDKERKLDPRFAEAMRTIRTAISLDNLDHPHKIILITSPVAGEGKSLIAFNLAVAFAGTERTLLLDADMRHPSVTRMLELPRDAPGLAELLAKNAHLNECVVRTSVSNLNVTPTGFIPPDPLQLMSSARMASTLKGLAKAYSRIIIDCPPILPVSDAALLSKYADSVLFVVKSDATTVAQVNRGLGLLKRVNAPITGIVLTQLDTRKDKQYGEYGAGGYYAPYGLKS